MQSLPRWLLPFALTGIAAICVFILPWWIPLTVPAYSSSYTYGFNNTFAWIALGGIVALLAAWRIAWPGSVGRPGVAAALTTLLTPADEPINRQLRFAALGFTLIVLGFIAWWFWYLPYAYFGEIQNFLPRLDLMALG